MMSDFTFDLQRFIGVWKIDDEIYSTLTEALAAITGNAIITLTADTSETVSGIIPDGITIDLGNYTFTVVDGSLTLADGVTWQNGNLIISGGTFTGNFNVNENATLSISGGTFSTDVSSYLDENFYLYQNENGYTVTEKNSQPEVTNSNDTNTDNVTSNSEDPVTNYSTPAEENSDTDYSTSNDESPVVNYITSNPKRTIRPVANYLTSNNEGTVYTLSGVNDSITVSVGDEAISLTGGNGGDIVVSVTTASGSSDSVAIINLQSVNNEFNLNGDSYKLTGGNGIIVTIGSSSKVTVGDINSGDAFLLGGTNGNNYLMTSLGLFGGSNSKTDKLLFDSTTSSVAFDGTTPENLASDWYKILEADNGGLNISTANSFYDSAYKGVIIADSETDSQKIYGELSKVNLNDYHYQISSIKGSTASLSNITLGAGAASEGVAFTENFAGENAPTIKAEETTFTVRKSNGYFILSGEKNKPVALSSAAQEITLIEGSLNSAVNGQTITAGDIILSDYTGGSSNDGVVLYSSSDHKTINLSDLESGEQFNLTNGTFSGTFKVTNVGLVRVEDGKDILLSKDKGNTVFKVEGMESWSADTILNASALSGYIYADAGVITISAGTSNNTVSTFVSYQNEASATLKVVGKSATLETSLTSEENKDYRHLHPGDWSGINIVSSGTGSMSTVVVDPAFSSDSSLYSGDGTYLKITTGAATFGLGHLKSFFPVTIKPSSDLQTLPSNVQGINLVNGTIQGSSNQVVTIEGAGGIEVTETYNSVKIIASSDGASILSATNTHVKVGRSDSLTPGNNDPITIDKDGNTSVKLSSARQTLTLDTNSSASIQVTFPQKTTGSVTVIYGKTTTDGDYVTDLDSGDKFTVQSGSTTRNYEVVGNKLIVTNNSDSVERFWKNDIDNGSKVPLITLSESEFTPILRVNNGEFSLDTTDVRIANMALKSEVAIVDNNDITKIYGYITKNSNNRYSLTKGDETLTSVTIKNNLIVDFDSSFQNVTINVTGTKDTTFLSAAGTSFTVNNNDSATGAIWVEGTNEVSLVDGTLWSSLNTQSITAGDYTVTPSLEGAGRAIYIDASSSDKIYIVGDLDSNESFNVNDTLYTYSPYPIGLTSGGKVLNPKYYVSPGLENSSSKLAVSLNNLIDESNFGTLLSATEGVFSIGSGDNTVTGTVVDDKEQGKTTTRYAQLDKIGFTGYELTSIENGTTWDNANASMIAVAAGANATINTSLVQGKSIFAEISGATFKVTASEGDTFTIDGSSGAPTIENATTITLLSGTITATKGQTIRLGENGTSFVSSSDSGINITYDEDNFTFNITGAVGDTFTLAKKEYAVVNGDGMNFIVDNEGNVTVNNLANDYVQDAFTYDGLTYSLRSAGLIRSTVTGSGKNTTIQSSLWGGEGNHSLTTESISIAELTTASNWGAMATVSDGVATIIPDNRGNNSLTFVDDGFEIIYGKLEKDTTADNNIYSLTATSDTTETLDAINVTNSTAVNGLYLGKTFSSVSILSPNSTVQVAGLESGKDNYFVTLYSGAMGLSGVKNADLLNGSFVLDNENSDNKNLTVSFGERSIKAGDDTTITLAGTASGSKGISASNVTIKGLDVNESFTIYDISGSRTYSLGSLGLINDKSELLDISQFSPKGEENNTIQVSTIMGGDWRGYIAPENNVLNISSSNKASVFIVDTEPPATVLATLTPVDSLNGSYLTTNTEWPSTDSIKVDGTTVTLSSAFEDKTIEGERSDAIFTISDIASTGSFVVKDASSGAIVSGSPTNTKFTINQKGGTIVASNKNQTISADGYYIAYSSSDCIKVAVNEEDGTASIGALTNGDKFSIGSAEYTMTSARRLQTDSKIFNDTISSSTFVPVTELAALTNYDNWSDIITITGANFTINGSTTTVLPDSGSALVIDVDDPDKSYGTLTETADGYSLSTVGSSGDTLKGITVSKGEKPLSLTSDFSRTTITAVGNNGRTTLLAQSPADSIFTVDYQGNYVKVNDVDTVLLARGTILPSTSEQKISANNSVISGFGFFDEDSLITVMFDGTSVKVGELNDGETFKVGSATYKLVDAIGLIDTTTNKLCSSGYDKGVFTVGSEFDTTLLAAENKVLTIPNALSESALFVDDVDNPTAKVANLSYGSSRFTLTPYNADSIDAVALGGNTTPLITTFDTKVITGKNSYTFTVNNNAYLAANSALTIHSGTKDSGSRLVSGKVSLVAGDVASVRTEDNRVNVTGGGLTFEVAESAVATLSSFSDGDTFVVDGTNYNVAGTNLINVSDNRIWTDTTYSNILIDSTSDNGLTKSDNWSYYINLSGTVLDIPPTENVGAGSWVILSDDKKTRYGTLSLTGTNSYAIETIKGNSWPTSDAIRVGDVTVSLPVGFQYVPIKGAHSGAEFTITENVGFTVTEGTSVTGASIGSATKISQTGGTIALTKDTNQTITATSNEYKVYVPSDSEGDGITVIVNGTSASVGALSVTEPQDTFAVGTNTYKMLPNGSIQRLNDKKYWINTIVEDGGAVAIPDLVDKSNDSANWIGYIEIDGDTLTIDETKLTTYNPAFVIAKDDPTKIYGKLSRDTTSGLYTLDGKNKTSNASLTSIVVTTGAQPVSLTTDYYTIPITAGDTQFKVTTATGGGFQINYPSANSLSMSGATEFELIKGKWTLTDPTQILTADEQTVQISAGGGVTVTYQNTADGVNITGIDEAGETVLINGENYALNSADGEGISVKVIKDGKTTVNDISDDDNFTYNNNTFIKKTAGFIKKRANNGSYLWINSADVTEGVVVESLQGDNENIWAGVAAVSDGNLNINSKSSTRILIDSTDSLSAIYGTLSRIDAENYTLTADNSNDEKLNSITVDKVTATIADNFARISINAAGADFAVTSLTSGSSFTVDATDKNAVIGNVSDVSLYSGTLANLTAQTSVKAEVNSDTKTIAAQDTTTIDINLTGDEITISELDDGENFNLNKDAYTYKNAGIVKGEDALFVNSSLNGAITVASLEGANYRTMFESDGKTLVLQTDKSGVFVDSADTNVKDVYATQDRSGRSYTFTNLDDGNHTIDAASLTAGSITAAFDSLVKTSEGGTYTINGKPYTAVSDLNVTTTEETSTLTDGTVSLKRNGTTFVDVTNADNSIVISSGDGIEVTAVNGGDYILSELNKNDVFTIGGYSYAMKSDITIVRTDASGNQAIYTEKVAGGSLAQGVIEENSLWDSFIALDRYGNLSLSSTVEGGTVISYDFTKIYADLTSNNGSFTISKLDKDDTADIKTINLANENSTLTTDFDATINTASGSSIYRINNKSYTAKGSELEIAATADPSITSAITKGTITLNNSTVATTSNHTIEGNVTELTVNGDSMKFSPVKDETFTIDDTSYKMTVVGLIKGGVSIWTTDDTEFDLPSTTNWSKMKNLTADGVLNLRDGADAGSTIVIDNGNTTRMASLDYSDNTYTLKSLNGNEIATVQFGDSTDTVTVTADFKSTFAINSGIYKVNGDTYKGNNLQIRTDDNYSAFYSGTVSLSSGDSVTDYNNSYNVKTKEGDLTVVATGGTITTLSNLTNGDVFTIDDVSYKVLGNQTLVKLDANGEPYALYSKDLVLGTSANYLDIVGDNYVNFVKLNDGVLDLTTRRGEDGWSAIVLAKDSNGDYTTRIAEVNYTDENGYELKETSDGDYSQITSVELSAVKKFSSVFDTNINTKANGEYTINGKAIFNARANLEIVTEDGSAILTSGSVTVAEGENYAITTRRTNGTTKNDEKIQATSGSIIVTVEEETTVDETTTPGTVTISGLAAGEKFTVDGTEYTMTKVGLLNGSLLNTSVAGTNSITTANLSGDDWLTILSVTDGSLPLTSSTVSNVLVVDLTNERKYGTLTKSDDTYTLSQEDGDSQLTSITIDSTKATFGTKTLGVNITTNSNATFNVTATDATNTFTVNAVSTNPIVTNAAAVSLSAGTMQVTIGIPITANGKTTVTANSGSMTVSVSEDKTKVIINGLNPNEEFTVDGVNYKMTTAGLINVTDSANYYIVTSGVSADLTSFTIEGDISSERIIAVDGSNLALAQETSSAWVYDSKTTPTKKLASYTYDNTGKKTLEGESTASTAILTVGVATGDDLTIKNFATQVESSGAGLVTVNGTNYSGTTALKIKAAADGTTSTLYNGTITLNETYGSATDSNNNTLTRDSGTFNVTATDGKFTTVSNLANEGKFTYDGATYIQAAPGLINLNKDVICPDILAGATITLSNLNALDWNDFRAAVDGVLDVSDISKKTIIYDSETAPTTQLATLTVGEGKKNLEGVEIASRYIDTINISVGDDLTITNFAAQVASPDAGLITVNTKNYNGTTALVVNADSDGATSTLYEGTITLDRIYPSATDARGNTLSRNNDTFTATAASGKFTTLIGIDTEESFTYNNVTYTQSTQGLRNGALIRTDLRPAVVGTTIELDNLTAAWDNLLAPTDGVLDISDFDDNAYVYNSATNPTIQLATLTYSVNKKTLTNYENNAIAISTVKIGADDDLTVNFATNVNSAVGTVTVNGNPFVGTTELTISAAADGKTSTLTTGTVSLTGKNDGVTTTGGSVITYTTEGGDGMTVTASVSGTAEIVTFNGLTFGDTFTVGDKSYKVSAVGPVNSDGKIWSGSDYTQGITLTALNTESNWTPMLVAATDESLSVTAETLTDGVKATVVDNISDPTKIYANLTNTGGTYALTKPSYANGTLTAFKSSGTTVEIAPEFAGVKLIANDTNEYSDTALKDAEKTFTLNTTGTNPTLSDNVQSLTLTAGTIAATLNQIVTVGETIITPTAINGSMLINTTTISGIVEGDEFKLGDKAYKMLATGLFNDTDNTLVTTGMEGDTLTFGGIAETQLIAVDSAGALDLSKAATGDSIVVDTVESPANIYGRLSKNENTYTLNKESTADGIKSVTMPDADSTLTTDLDKEINTPSGSHKFTVNSKAYTASDSALVIKSDGTTSTLTDGTVSLLNNNDAVKSTGGIEVTYTSSGDGMTVTATANGTETVKVGGLTAGDTFNIDGNSYKVAEAGPMNSSGAIWTSTADYTAGLTVASTGDDGIYNADNWTALLVATNGNLLVNTRTLENGGKVAVVDDADNPTKAYGYLTRTDDSYTLTKPAYVNSELNSITASNTTIEIAPGFAGINLIANDSAFSDTTINDATQTFTLDASGETPILSDNIKSLTLTAGTILADTDQSVTVDDNTIKPSVINGTMVIGTDKITGIVEGDRFLINDKAYKMLSTGLFNDTDDRLVTEGMENGALTFEDMVETQLIAVDSAGALDLSRVSTSDTIVVDNVENPANIYGKISKLEETYTLNEQGTAGGIKSVTMPNNDSTLITDIATVINAASSSHKFTVNSKAYAANSSALVIDSDGRTSTLTDGRISLTDNKDTVTTTSGSTVAYTTESGDGMTVEATTSGTVTLDGLTSGDKFKVDDDSYKVTALGFHNDDNDLWTGRADYRNGVTISNTGNTGINNADNWTKTVTAEDDALDVRANTLSDGDTAIIIDSADNSTKTLGTLTKTGDVYTLEKSNSDAKLASIAVINTTMTIDQELADVPVTADGATFTVTALEPFTVDSTGDVAEISEDAKTIELTAGTIAATTNQTVTATADSGNTYVIGQDNGTFSIGGKDFVVAANENNITFGMINGEPNSVGGLEADATVTIDGTTYTAPEDDSTLKFSDAEGWYFDGYVPDKYNILIDGNRNIILDPGIKFTDVVASGRVLTDSNTIKLAADVNSVPVNITNSGTAAISVIDKNDNPLVENLGTVSNVLFDSAGVMVENTSDVAGAVFTLDNGKSFETETATVKANASDCAVGIGTDGTALSIDKAATIDAPRNTELTLSNATYTVKDVTFRANGTAQASITSGGVKLDLVKSDTFTYDGTRLNGTGTATATIEQEGRVSLTSGASLNGADGRILNIAGTVTLDANTINAATATDVTAKASGLAVGDDDVTITGDNDGYKVDIEGGVITGFENIGNADGVTLGGLANGTVKTDKIGAFTVADRTFIAAGDSFVIYGIKDGRITFADDVDSIISGTFNDGITVNGGKIQATGDNISLRADTEDYRELRGFGDSATIVTAEGVHKVEPISAGRFTFGEHVFETDDPSIAFNLQNSSVTGIDSLENGMLIISQDEFNLGINDKSLTLTDLAAPVTLNIANSLINSVGGLDGNIFGLDNATLYDVGTATVNGKKLDIDGTDYTATVIDGTLSNVYGLGDGATVNAAQDMELRTTQNGSFTFRDDEYNINDTLDGVVVFTTNENSYVTSIGELEGSVSGGLEDLTLNGKPFGSSNDNVTVATDGEDIIGIYGLSNGDTITGSLSSATYVMPKGTLTVNEQEFILKGDEDGVSISGDGKVILGLDRDASLTVAKGGDYSVNSDTFKDAKDGTTFIATRNGVFIYDPNNTHIGEKTEPEDIIRNLIGDPEPGTISLSGDSAAALIDSGSLDGSMALTLDNSINNSVQTADFSESTGSKRVTLLGGDQDVKFNDDGGNAAYIASIATGRKNIELGDGNDVAVNDSPYAKVSIKAGLGEDTIVNRNDAKTTVDVKSNGDTTIVPTSGRVTLTNYDNNNHAKIRTYEYDDLAEAVKDNSIKFGDGNMTLGDAVVVFDPDAKDVGGTFANLVNYEGEEQRVGFTHTAGGVLNASNSSDNLVMKGGYRESSSDKRKTGASTLISGRGDDTILAGEGDFVNAGAGDNQIYVTDKALRGTDGATIVLGDKGRNTIHGFNGGYDDADAIQVKKANALEFIYGSDGLVMRSGNSQITFDGLDPAEEYITYDDAETAAPYELKIIEGKKEYNVAVAQEGMDIGVDEFSEAEIFYGEKNSGSGINFSEYSGPIEVNLGGGTGTLSGTAAQFFNINKLQAGDYDARLIGAAGKRNTLIAGTGNTSMWSAAGRDLMVGSADSEDKDGATTFFYMGNDGRDTITNFAFMTSANDYNADIISLPSGNIVSDVFMRGTDVVMGINGNANDYLVLQGAVGQNFKINDRVAKVDRNGTFDNLADYFVVNGANATMNVGADIGDAQVWLDDRKTGEHGVIYHGEIKYLDAKTANGNTTLVGNDLDNVIYGGNASNSIWGGYGMSRDTLVGGKGLNTFFFGYNNGNDTITSVNAGDIIDLSSIALEEIAGTTVTAGGTKIELTDGSSLEIQGNAADVEYRLIDGSKYTADHGAGHWNRK